LRCVYFLTFYTSCLHHSGLSIFFLHSTCALDATANRHRDRPLLTNPPIFHWSPISKRFLGRCRPFSARLPFRPPRSPINYGLPLLDPLPLTACSVSLPFPPRAALPPWMLASASPARFLPVQEVNCAHVGTSLQSFFSHNYGRHVFWQSLKSAPRFASHWCFRRIPLTGWVRPAPAQRFKCRLGVFKSWRRNADS